MSNINYTNCNCNSLADGSVSLDNDNSSNEATSRKSHGGGVREAHKVVVERLEQSTDNVLSEEIDLIQSCLPDLLVRLSIIAKENKP